jgi:hypothetical protein
VRTTIVPADVLERMLFRIEDAQGALAMATSPTSR